jgi:hypothetical protein
MHDCFLCGQACYCHGDIDDCQVETVEYAYMNCEGCGCPEDEDFLDVDCEPEGGLPDLRHDEFAWLENPR